MQRVLVVDDDMTWSDLVRQALEDDYWVEQVTTAAKAERRVVQGAADVLITETHLPDLAGWSLVARLHDVDATLPVIVATDDDSWETAHQVRVARAHVFYFALKPVDMADLRAVVDCAMRWRETRQRRAHVPLTESP